MACVFYQPLCAFIPVMVYSAYENERWFLALTALVPLVAADGLTDKETGILRCIAEGLSNREISEALYLSEGTVRNYVSVMLEKLALRDPTQLAIFYFKNKD